ncbi:beta-1,3-glucan-binding protein-like [Leptidea sinapis]|uniref:beta-1,3-glucan-binding protein-like n=1 Tax=Leptidea sinapis TaxID=189913 RepID=UPI00212C36C4|nr:beta-1,3-glucan-binding protein-like [Leptidea sinapis]
MRRLQSESVTCSDGRAMVGPLLACALLLCAGLVRGYQVPSATLEAIYPRGLRVSVPDDGFTLFAFHGKLNEEMDGLEGGTWSRDINAPHNGRWTFEDDNAELKIGDKIYFWTYVIKNGLGYRQDDGEWTVDGYVDKAGDPVILAGTTTTTNADPSIVPSVDPSIDPYTTASVDPSTDPNTTASVDPSTDPNTTTSVDPSTDPITAPGVSPNSELSSETTTDSPAVSASTVPLSAVEPEADEYQFPCKVSATQVTSAGFVCRGQLLFEDTFDGDLDKGKIWTPEIKMPCAPEFPFNVYLYDKNIETRDGKLVIEPELLETKYGDGFLWETLDLTLKCTGKVGTKECYREASGPEILPPVITGKITSKRRFSFKYGRVEVVAKMPLGDWLVPEIQLEPARHEYGSSRYASGLLQIALVKGNAEFAKKLYAGPIMSDSEPFRSKYLKEKIGLENWNNGYHNYTLLWKPDSIQMFVDGEKYGEVDAGEGFYEEGQRCHVRAAPRWLKGTAMAPFDELFYISLGLSVGGVHEFPDAARKPWHNRGSKAMLQFWEARDQWYPTWFPDTSALRIDSVRVFAL